MLNAGQVVDSEALIDAIWGPAGGDRTMLKQLVYRLRQKLEPNPSDPEYVRHVSGVGYSFEA
jgi:DNA-binding response OmpR family regulator